MTVMVLELVPPHGTALGDLVPLLPVFASYVLSFAILAIYWNNHHHLLQAARAVDGRVLWANMHLLFWLSLFPFGTAWIGDTGLAPVPMAVYGGILVMAAIAYFLLVRALMAVPGQSGTIGEIVAEDVKGRISPAIYALAIPISLVAPLVGFGLYVFVAAIWIVPDPRIERRLRD